MPGLWPFLWTRCTFFREKSRFCLCILSVTFIQEIHYTVISYVIWEQKRLARGGGDSVLNHCLRSDVNCTSDCHVMCYSVCSRLLLGCASHLPHWGQVFRLFKLTAAHLTGTRKSHASLLHINYMHMIL